MYFQFRSIFKKTNKISFNLYILLDNIIFIFRKIPFEISATFTYRKCSTVWYCIFKKHLSECRKKSLILSETLLFWSSKSVSSFCPVGHAHLQLIRHFIQHLWSNKMVLTYLIQRIGVDECVVIFQLNNEKSRAQTCLFLKHTLAFSDCLWRENLMPMYVLLWPFGKK